jgi:hypothetical protein
LRYLNNRASFACEVFDRNGAIAGSQINAKTETRAHLEGLRQ